MKPCPKCDGSGIDNKRSTDLVDEPCMACGGSGEEYDDLDEPGKIEEPPE